MGGKASKLRRSAANTIALPCVSFSNDTLSAHSSSTTSTRTCSLTTITANDERKVKVRESKAVVDKVLCAICLEPLNSLGGDSNIGENDDSETIFTAQCKHTFHFTCIQSNVRHGSINCPICRAHWPHLPRELITPSCNSTDPVLRILDDSIASSRVNRRSFLRSTRYNDDDPVDAQAASEPTHPRLSFTVIPITNGISPHTQYVRLMSLHHQYQLSSSPTVILPNYGQHRAYLAVKLSHQQATDLVLVASPNGPHLRLLKQSMALVVFSLRPIDRLAIVTYSTTASRVLPLRRMTTQGKRAALQVIDRLCYLGDAEPNSGLRKGLKVLEDRTYQNPLPCILHLSDNPTTCSYVVADLQVPIPIHRFHIGFGFGMPNGFVMHEFEEFLAKMLGGVVREVQVRIGEDEGWLRLGDLRGGQEKRIPLDLTDDCGFITVNYSYVECGAEQRMTNGETVVGIEEKCERNDCCQCDNDSVSELSHRGRSSCVERWDYLDPFMARRWAKHLHGNKA